MSLQAEINKLKSIAGDATTLFNALKGLAHNNLDATKAQKNKLAALATQLDATTTAASRESLNTKIDQISKSIAQDDAILSVAGLSSSLRNSIKAGRLAKLAKRARLRAKLGADFSGLLSRTEADQLVKLIAKAKAEVKNKKQAAAFLTTAVTVADMALTIAGKLAM